MGADGGGGGVGSGVLVAWSSAGLEDADAETVRAPAGIKEQEAPRAGSPAEGVKGRVTAASPRTVANRGVKGSNR